MSDINNNAPVEGDPAGMPWGCLVILAILGLIALGVVMAGAGNGFL